MAVRFLHLSDVDLGARSRFLGDGAAERGREVLDTFRDAVQFALDPGNRIDGVLIAGNLLDRHRPDPETWSFARGLLARLAAAGRAVIIIPGSRDSALFRNAIWRAERLPGMDVLTATAPGPQVTREIGGETVHFYAAVPRPGAGTQSFAGFERSEAEGLHVGLVNGAIPGLTEWDVRPRDLGLDRDTLSAADLDYIALGGYHGALDLAESDTTGLLRASYCGSPEGREFVAGDLGPRHLLVAEVAERSVRYERIPTGRAVLDDIVIDLGTEGIRDPEALMGALLARADRKLMARVTLVGTLEFLCDHEEVADRVRSRFRYLQIEDRTDLLGSAMLRRIEGEHTVRGFFVRRTLQRMTELEDRIRDSGQTAPLQREMKVARLALKLGLEQFLEEEAAPDLFETTGAEAAPELEDPESGLCESDARQPALAVPEPTRNTTDVPDARMEGETSA